MRARASLILTSARRNRTRSAWIRASGAGGAQELKPGGPWRSWNGKAGGVPGGRRRRSRLEQKIRAQVWPSGQRVGQVSAIRAGTGQRAGQGAPRPAEIPSPGAALSVRSRSDGGQWLGGASGRGQESRGGFGAVLLPGDGGRQRGVGPEMDMLPRSSALV